MTRPIDFYFDFSSPYGYLASHRIDDIGSKYNRSVIWRPYLLGAVFKVNGRRPLPQQPLVGEYAHRDILRCARLYDIPLTIPQNFPISSVSPSRAFYWVHDQDREKAKALARALYTAYFVDGRDISVAEQVIEVAAALGIDRSETASALQDASVKERLRQETEAAIARGAFGSPYIFVDDEPFWGNDRLDQVERWLATGGW